MAPELITTQDFTSSRYAQVADNIEGNLSDIITRAEAAIKSKLRFNIKNKAYTETWRSRTNTLFVEHRPIISVTSIKRRPSYRNAWETLDLSSFYVEKEAGYIESQWDTVAGHEVEVVYNAGYDIIPDDIKEAVTLMTVFFAYQDTEVYGSGDGRRPGILYIEDQVDELIAPYRKTATVYH
jgi:hypothetical protein